MLTYGANVDATDRYSFPPLRRTVDQGHLALAELLIRNGADVTTRDSSGVTLLHVLARTDNIMIAELLIAEGTDVNAMDSFGFTPLDYGQGGEVTMIETLKRHGAACTIC